MLALLQLRLEKERKERQKFKEKERKQRRKLEGKPITKKDKEAENRRLAYLATQEELGTGWAEVECSRVLNAGRFTPCLYCMAHVVVFTVWPMLLSLMHGPCCCL